MASCSSPTYVCDLSRLPYELLVFSACGVPTLLSVRPVLGCDAVLMLMFCCCAFATISQLNKRQTAYQRANANQVKQCNTLQRIIRYFEEELKKLEVCTVVCDVLALLFEHVVPWWGVWRSFVYGSHLSPSFRCGSPCNSVSTTLILMWLAGWVFGSDCWLVVPERKANALPRLDQSHDAPLAVRGWM